MTSAEFSPKNDCGVFFVAPVDGLGPAEGNMSPSKFNSKESEWFPFVLGDAARFLLVIASNSSKSVDELWLVGDHGSWFCVAFSAPVVLLFHGSAGFGPGELVGSQGSAGTTCCWLGGDESVFECHGLVYKDIC